MGAGRGRRTTRTVTDRRQLSLLTDLADLVAIPDRSSDVGNADDDQALRRAINRLIRASRYDRDEIAGRMGQLAGRPITSAMLNTWTAPSRTNAFPARYLRALILACDTDASGLLSILLADTGHVVIDAQTARQVRIGQCYALMLQAQHEAARLTGSAELPVEGR